MTALADLGREIGSIAETVGPSVVGIGNRWRGGSGVVIGENRILTNAHNLHGDEVTVTFADGRTAEATVAGVDTDGDLAVLEAATEGIAPLALGMETPGVGAPVVALGNPNGHGPRVTFGFVSGTGRSFRGPRGRRVAGAVEHTAPLMPGSSGGPVVDLEGNLLGINTNRLGNGFYLAIAADAALRDRVAALGRGESPTRRRLGVGLAPATWRASFDVRSGFRSATASSCARSRRTPPPRRPASRRATSSSPSASDRSPAPTTCSTRSPARALSRSASSGAPRS